MRWQKVHFCLQGHVYTLLPQKSDNDNTHAISGWDFKNNDILFHQFQISTYFVKDLIVERLSDMSSEIYGN